MDVLGRGLTVVLSLVVVAGLFFGGNAILVGGQKLWHYRDSQGLERLKTEMDADEAAIGRLEQRLTELERSITAVESRFPAGIPSENYPSYVAAVDEFNRLVNEYNHRVDRYNRKVDEANALAEKVGTTWYIVPVPRGSRRR